MDQSETYIKENFHVCKRYVFMMMMMVLRHNRLVNRIAIIRPSMEKIIGVFEDYATRNLGRVLQVVESIHIEFAIRKPRLPVCENKRVNMANSNIFVRESNRGSYKEKTYVNQVSLTARKIKVTWGL